MRRWSEMLRFTNDFGFKFLKFASRYYPPENHCCFNHFIQDLLVINFGRTRENLRNRWNLLRNFENKVEIDMIFMVLTLSKNKLIFCNLRSLNLTVVLAKKAGLVSHGRPQTPRIRILRGKDHQFGHMLSHDFHIMETVMAGGSL